MIKPTVGRKVWYWPSKFDRTGPKPMVAVGSQDAGNLQPLDATIVAVWGDRCVNLVVHDANGSAFQKFSVTLRQEGDEPLKDADGKEVLGHAEWMPYQVGQAKKD